MKKTILIITFIFGILSFSKAAILKGGPHEDPSRGVACNNYASDIRDSWRSAGATPEQATAQELAAYIICMRQ